MYTLYFIPGACSLATQVVLRELNQPVELILRDSVDNFEALNPVGTVPVLTTDKQILREGAGILMYLLDKYENTMMPTDEKARRKAVEDILFANATMHPTYSRLFFTMQNVEASAQTAAYAAAAKAINHLWAVVEKKLKTSTFLGGEYPSAADILLAVYQRWGANFPVEITLGPKAQAMVDAVQSMPSFVASLAAEDELS